MSVTAMPRRFYGRVASLPDPRDATHEYRPKKSTLFQLPTTVDLTNPKLPAPFETCLNQGQQGSCGPNSVTECIMVDAELNEGFGSTFELPSRAYIYYMTRMLMGTTNQDSGVDNRTMMKALAQYGWCDDKLMKYSDMDYKTAPTPAATAQAASRKAGLAYASIPQSLAAMQSALAEKKPWVFGFTVRDSFESAQTAQTGIVTVPHLNESVLGGHDLSILGFTMVDMPGNKPGLKWPARTLKARNHWYEALGIPWGDDGCCYIPFEMALNPQMSNDFWALITTGATKPTPPSPPGPTPFPPTDTMEGMAVNILRLDGKTISNPARVGDKFSWN